MNTPPILAIEFEQACERELYGNLWDNTFNADATYPVSLSVGEIRYIANVLRDAQGLARREVFDPIEKEGLL